MVTQFVPATVPWVLKIEDTSTDLSKPGTMALPVIGWVFVPDPDGDGSTGWEMDAVVAYKGRIVDMVSVLDEIRAGVTERMRGTLGEYEGRVKFELVPA